MSLSDDGGYGGDGHRGSETGQTRTRLPDNDGDIYGSGRRPRAGMSSRNLVTIVGVIVLLLAAIAFANRGGSGNSETPPATPPRTPATPSPPPPPAPSRPPARTAASPRASPRRSRGRSRRRRIMRWRWLQHGHVQARQAARDRRAVYAPSVAAARKNKLDEAYSTALPQAGSASSANGSARPGNDLRFAHHPRRHEDRERSRATRPRVEVWYTGLFGTRRRRSTEPRHGELVHDHHEAAVDRRGLEGRGLHAEGRPRSGQRGQAAASAARTSPRRSKAYGGFTYAR